MHLNALSGIKITMCWLFFTWASMCFGFFLPTGYIIWWGHPEGCHLQYQQNINPFLSYQSLCIETEVRWDDVLNQKNKNDIVRKKYFFSAPTPGMCWKCIFMLDKLSCYTCTYMYITQFVYLTATYISAILFANNLPVVSVDIRPESDRPLVDGYSIGHESQTLHVSGKLKVYIKYNLTKDRS